MLAVAHGLPVADSEPATLATQRENLLEVLIRLFATQLLAAVRRGLPHRYRVVEDDLPLLRGKLDVPRQLTRHAMRPDRLACRFDELSVDTPLKPGPQGRRRAIEGCNGVSAKRSAAR